MIVSCNKKNVIPQSQDPSETNQNFDWLLGDWKRINNQENQQTFETWIKNSNTEYSGIGFTLQNLDTISQEKMMLIKSDSEWRLEVVSPEDSASTIFKMTKMNTNRFICENPAIEFPKKIEYWKEEEKMKAKVSNETMEIPFEFERINRK